jgi:hypothetical protein
MKDLFDSISPGRIRVHPDDLAEMQSKLRGGGVSVGERYAQGEAKKEATKETAGNRTHEELGLPIEIKSKGVSVNRP